MQVEKPKSCIGCNYYYITWDKNYPKGCKGFGFKSASMPFQVVKDASGEFCKMYKPKDKRGN